MLSFIITPLSGVTVTVKKVNFRTYPFSDPDPVAKIGRIYPYFRFDGFSKNPVKKSWKMIILENELIKLWIAPEIGGKVWGAVDKATGIPFIYFNKAVKFRDIAMRGPWTSGGIEFNFGAIGHTPNVATPVDYKILRHKDGSVSVFLGTMDLSSRSFWQVEVKLSDGKAYFETNTFWYNPTNFHTSFYHWLNGSTDTGNDLKYYFPGIYYLTHNGDFYQWPINKDGVNISFYKNNNFGSYKAYHIFGKYSDYFSLIWQSKKIGSGHWSFYADKPGKKIWMWGLSREGQIWEDLLADRDLGNRQYTETQAGALFIQAGHSSLTPFKHVYFLPQDTMISKERWFLVKGLKKITNVNECGAFNISKKEGLLNIEISPFEEIKEQLKIIEEDNDVILKKQLELNPLELYKDKIKIDKNKKVRVLLGDRILFNSSVNNVLRRPTKNINKINKDNFYFLYLMGIEKSKQRYYDEALKLLLKAFKAAPYFSPVQTELSELYYRRMEYRKSLYYSKLALSENTYNPKANFYYALSSLKIGNIADAKDGFSISAKSPEYRSASFYNLAEIYFREKNYEYAEIFAKRSLIWNKYNLNSYRLLSIIYRKKGLKEQARSIHDKLMSLYQLSHFPLYENYLLTKNKAYLEELYESIQNEFPYQSFLELSLYYYRLGLLDESLSLLKLSPQNALINYWKAYLYHLKGDNLLSERMLGVAIKSSPYLIFPFREESVAPFKWTLSKCKDWKSKYYLGLIYWSKYRIKDAKRLFSECKQIPDYPPFYLTKAKLFEEDSPEIAERAYKRALKLNRKSWRVYHMFYKFLKNKKRFREAFFYAKMGAKYFKNSFIIQFDYADALYHVGRFEKAIKILNTLTILPSEAAIFGRISYNRNYIMHAIKLMNRRKFKKAIKVLEKAKLWPEHLGAGKPYAPDDRVEDYLEAVCYEKIGKKRISENLLKNIIAYTIERKTEKLAKPYPIYDFFCLFAAKKLGISSKVRMIKDVIKSRGEDFKELEDNLNNVKFLKNYYSKLSPDSSKRFFLKILLSLKIDHKWRGE